MFTVPKISLFQFHKGTIKTLMMCLVLLTLLNFNSIKVQLRRVLHAILIKIV